MEVKTISNYDMKRILGRIPKEFGKIEKGMEENYNPQLDYIEQAIYEINTKIPISDYELQEAIIVIIYDLKSYIDDITYDYKEIVDEKVIEFAKTFQQLFNPFINNNIKVNTKGISNLNHLFKLPIICLCRIYDSIDFWRNLYGKNGYFKMLKKMVVPIKQVGKFPYALEEQYLELDY